MNPAVLLLYKVACAAIIALNSYSNKGILGEKLLERSVVDSNLCPILCDIMAKIF